MASSITLTTVWMNLASNLSQYQNFPAMSILKPSIVQPGEVRTYANGRLRLITRAGLARSYSLTLIACSRAQITWLENNVGQLFCVRDDRGRKIYATFFDVPVLEESTDPTLGDVTLALSEVTHSEIV